MERRTFHGTLRGTHLRVCVPRGQLLVAEHDAGVSRHRRQTDWRRSPLKSGNPYGQRDPNLRSAGLDRVHAAVERAQFDVGLRELNTRAKANRLIEEIIEVR